MRRITIDAAGLSPALLHAAFAQQLAFPAWYGHNLDALFDCLTELETPTQLTVRNLCAGAFRDTLLDAAAENSKLQLTFE